MTRTLRQRLVVTFKVGSASKSSAQSIIVAATSNTAFAAVRDRLPFTESSYTFLVASPISIACCVVSVPFSCAEIVSLASDGISDGANEGITDGTSLGTSEGILDAVTLGFEEGAGEAEGG